MSLLTSYQGRYSLELRTNSSNPQNSGQTSPDSTREGYAAADAQADFETICGVAYDDSVAIHVTAAVPLVYYKLLVYTGQASGEWYDQQLGRLNKWYRLVLGRNRMVPNSDSTLQPTTPTPGAVPYADISQFQRYVGNAPGSPTVTNSGGESGSFPLGE